MEGKKVYHADILKADHGNRMIIHKEVFNYSGMYLLVLNYHDHIHKQIVLKY
jgi:hypothetical protein